MARPTAIYLRKVYVFYFSAYSHFLQVGHRSQLIDHYALNKDSGPCFPVISLSHVVALPNCRPLRHRRVYRMEREAVVIPGFNATSAIYNPVSKASPSVFHFAGTESFSGQQPQSWLLLHCLLRICMSF